MTLLATCPACGSSDVRAQHRVPEMMFGLNESFSYAECGGCGTLRLQEVPDDLSAYYPQDYYSVDMDPQVSLGRPPVRQVAAVTSRSVLNGSGRTADLAGRVIRKRQFHTLMSIMRSVSQAGLPRGRDTSVLDVGCGSGALIYALTLSGLKDVTGVDPFAPGDRRLDTGARILKRDLSEVEGSYDLVMFHHSFEHVPDPAASLDAAIARLSPQGRILVRMPTTSSKAFETYGPDWVQLDAPRHLTVFSRQGMEELCRRRGLRVVSLRDDSTAFQFWGSEQAKAGVALNDPGSHMFDTSKSGFTSSQLDEWEAEAKTLNSQGRGDQAAWVLAPV